jgi:hypothetical protein
MEPAASTRTALAASAEAQRQALCEAQRQECARLEAAHAHALHAASALQERFAAVIETIQKDHAQAQELVSALRATAVQSSEMRQVRIDRALARVDESALNTSELAVDMSDVTVDMADMETGDSVGGVARLASASEILAAVAAHADALWSRDAAPLWRTVASRGDVGLLGMLTLFSHQIALPREQDVGLCFASACVHDQHDLVAAMLRMSVVRDDVGLLRSCFAPTRPRVSMQLVRACPAVLSGVHFASLIAEPVTPLLECALQVAHELDPVVCESAFEVAVRRRLSHVVRAFLDAPNLAPRRASCIMNVVARCDLRDVPPALLRHACFLPPHSSPTESEECIRFFTETLLKACRKGFPEIVQACAESPLCRASMTEGLREALAGRVSTRVVSLLLEGGANPFHDALAHDLHVFFGGDSTATWAACTRQILNARFPLSCAAAERFVAVLACADVGNGVGEPVCWLFANLLSQDGLDAESVNSLFKPLVLRASLRDPWTMRAVFQVLRHPLANPADFLKLVRRKHYLHGVDELRELLAHPRIDLARAWVQKAVKSLAQSCLHEADTALFIEQAFCAAKDAEAEAARQKRHKAAAAKPKASKDKDKDKGKEDKAPLEAREASGAHGTRGPALKTEWAGL